MAARGPAPTPTPILKMRASRRADSRVGEPVLPVKVPTCPKWLGDEAKAEWRRISKLMVRMRTLTEADAAVLALYCNAWRQLIDAEKRLLTDGYTFETEKGYVGISPWVSIRDSSADRVLRLAAQLGLTPAARARLRAIPEEDSGEDEDDRFFGGAS